MFKILDKKSSSPTMMIIVYHHDPPIILKIWDKEDKSGESLALDYELNIYEKKINPLLKKDNTLPLLKYIGSGCSDVLQTGEFVGITSEEDWNTWITAFSIFLKNTRRFHRYNDVDYVKKFLIENSLDKSVLTHPIKCIMLPMVNYTTLSQAIVYESNKDTDQVMCWIAQIVKGIVSIYSDGIIHNDLHASNVMIEKNSSKVLIFDWDRSYINGIDNPLLNTDQCEGECGKKSQCNIYNKNGYSVDFYKVLSYVISPRMFGEKPNKYGDSNDILKRLGVPENAYTKVKEVLCENNKSKSFSDEDCTYLQYPNEDMKYVHEQFGSIFTVNAILNEEYRNEELKKDDMEEYKKMTEVKFNFENKMNKNTTLMEQNKMKQVDLIREKIYNSVKPVERVLTYNDLIKEKIRLTSNSLKPVEKVKTVLNLPTQSLVDIIEHNDMLKYGPGIE